MNLTNYVMIESFSFKKQEKFVKSLNKNNRRSWMVVAACVLVMSLAACQSSTATPDSSASGAPTLAITQAAVAPTATATPEAPIILEGAITTESGLQYLQITPGTGEAPTVGDIITIDYIATLADGVELDNTYTTGVPSTTIWGLNRLLPGWEEGIGLMKVGEKAKFVLPASLAFGETGYGSVPPNAQIVIEMELLASEAPPEPTTVKEDEYTTSETGLQYYDILTGDGLEILDNYSVTAQYTLWVKNESDYAYVGMSESDAPITFTVGGGEVFPGWDEGMLGMKVGGKRLMVLTPELGLGEQAYSDIPANSTLVLEVTVVEASEPLTATVVDEKDYITTASGLKYYDLVEGTGEAAAAGQTMVVNYTGWLEDGTQFDSSIDSGQTFSFVLGAGNVIAGWDEGIAGMKVGGKRQLVVPAELGYKDQANGIIPANSVLIFEVELLEIQK
jgi:peptidylprolyl isomerase